MCGRSWPSLASFTSEPASLSSPPPGNFSVPVYIRTCHRPSCTIMGTTSPWTDIDLKGSCCEGHLCNRGSMTQSFTAASAATPPLAAHVAALLLVVPLLVGTLRGPLCLSL